MRTGYAALTDEFDETHERCEAFYCDRCKFTFALSELRDKSVLKYEENGVIIATCPTCPDGTDAFKMSNELHLEAHVSRS